MGQGLGVPTIGPHIGLGDGVVSPMIDVTVDAGSGIYVPSSEDDWDITMEAAGISSGGPQNLWLLQEASGNCADTLGGVLVGPNVFVSPTRQNAIPGWTRKGIGSAEGTSQACVCTIQDGVVDLAIESYLLLAYVRLTATPGGEHPIMCIGGGGDMRYASVNATGYIAKNSGGTSTVGAASPGTTVHPVVLMVNRATSAFKVYTDQEVISHTWLAPAGGGGNVLVIGDAITGQGCAGAMTLYAAGFAGAAAELSDADVRSLLEILGWSVSW